MNNVSYTRSLNEKKDSLYYVNESISENSKVLDLGCWEGALGEHLRNEKNCIIDGVELNTNAADKARPFYRNVHVADLESISLDILDSQYDYIVCADVLEHIREPDRLLEKLKPLLAEKGKLIISLPNVGYGGVVAEILAGRFDYRNTGILDRTHYQFFTRATAIELIESLGFNVSKLRCVEAYLSDSEFSSHYYKKDVLDLKSILANVPDSGVYQFVMECCKSHAGDSGKDHDDPNELMMNFPVKVFWGVNGNNYTEESSVSSPASLNGVNSLELIIPKLCEGDYIRIDLCDFIGTISLYSFQIVDGSGKTIFDIKDNISQCVLVDATLKYDGHEIYTFDSATYDSYIEIPCSKTPVSSNKDWKIKVEMSYISKQSSVETKLAHSISEVKNIQQELDTARLEVSALLASSSWKLTSPVRILISGIRELQSKTKRNLQLLNRALNPNNGGVRGRIMRAGAMLIKQGPRAVIDKIKASSSTTVTENNDALDYQSWIVKDQQEGNLLAEKLLINVSSTKEPLISIIMPTYNTDENFLRLCIESVLNQSYQNWELCIADDASTDEIVSKVLNEYKERDKRINVKFCQENGHISKASNSALELMTGEFAVLLDHDDQLHKHALLFISETINKNPNVDFIYSDEDHIDAEGKRQSPFFKPGWSPALLYSQNYIGHMVCLSKGILAKIGGFTVGVEGAQDYDLLLKVISHTQFIVHIPRVLYHWRAHEESTAMNADCKPYAHDAGKKALTHHLAGKYPAMFSHIEDGENLFTYKPRFKLKSNIKTSIIIPIRDQVELLKQLVMSIKEKTTWSNYEVIIVDNGSVEEATLSYLAELQLDKKYKVIRDDSDFNWSKVNNIGVTIATGDVFVFLNNDTVVISNDWLESLLSWALLPEVAVVGPQLLYEDGTIQHAGVVVGMGGWADHVFKAEKPIHKHSPFVSPMLNRNVMAVTGACQAIEREKFEKLGCFDEAFEICGSDVELCIRAHKEGYQNVYLADTVLYHLESKSRSSFVPENDFALSRIKYEPYRTEGVDPFFNPNLDIMSPTPRVKL